MIASNGVKKKLSPSGLGQDVTFGSDGLTVSTKKRFGQQTRNVNTPALNRRRQNNLQKHIGGSAVMAVFAPKQGIFRHAENECSRLRSGVLNAIKIPKGAPAFCCGQISMRLGFALTPCADGREERELVAFWDEKRLVAVVICLRRWPCFMLINL